MSKLTDRLQRVLDEQRRRYDQHLANITDEHGNVDDDSEYREELGGLQGGVEMLDSVMGIVRELEPTPTTSAAPAANRQYVEVEIVQGAVTITLVLTPEEVNGLQSNLGQALDSLSRLQNR